MATRLSNAFTWGEALALLDRADRLHRQAFHPRLDARAARPGWEPPVDLFETDDALWIYAALPGVSKDQVQIVIEDGIIGIVGVRPLPDPARGGLVHRMELPHGRFERRIRLPAGRYELSRHTLVDGCLEVTLRKLAAR